MLASVEWKRGDKVGTNPCINMKDMQPKDAEKLGT